MVNGMTNNRLPVFLSGIVVHGFGRGSKDLGIPTANFEKEVVDAHSEGINTGVYYGWARVDNGAINKMVMSVGWNPFYKNKHKSMETHILHHFPYDFYGCRLRVAIIGYIRPELDFSSFDELVATIRSDIERAHQELDNTECVKYRDNEFLTVAIELENEECRNHTD